MFGWTAIGIPREGVTGGTTDTGRVPRMAAHAGWRLVTREGAFLKGIGKVIVAAATTTIAEIATVTATMIGTTTGVRTAASFVVDIS